MDAVNFDSLTKPELLNLARAAKLVGYKDISKIALIERLVYVYQAGDFRAKDMYDELVRMGKVGVKQELDPRPGGTGFKECQFCHRFFRLDFDFCPRCGKEAK